MKTVMVTFAVALMSGRATVTPLNRGAETGLKNDSDQVLYDEGFQHFREFKSTAASVQLELHHGEWTVDRYGAAPQPLICTDGTQGYVFMLDRSVAGTAINMSQGPTEFVEWLRTAGWESAGVSAEDTSNDESSVTVVRASGSPDGVIQTLLVSYYEATQSVLLKAESECFPGDQTRLFDLVFLDESSLIVPHIP